MISKHCQECGIEFQARSQANKNCGSICGNISANRLKAAKYLAKAGVARSAGTLSNDARMQIDAHVPNMLMSRQLWNKNIVLNVTA